MRLLKTPTLTTATCSRTDTAIAIHSQSLTLGNGGVVSLAYAMFHRTLPATWVKQERESSLLYRGARLETATGDTRPVVAIPTLRMRAPRA